MNQVREHSWKEDGDAYNGAARPDRDQHESLSGLNKVLPFALAPRDQAPEVDPNNTAPTPRDWSTALDLVRQAAEMIRAAEQRAEEREALTREVVQRATQQLEAAEARIQAAEARARAAEARAQAAEARAKEADEWLCRVHQVIVEEFLPGGGTHPTIEPRMFRQF
jgi:hypothetical protein